VEFNALQSSDRDGSITDYSWDFGDGVTSLGSQVNHTYTGLGVFSVTLTVTDNDGSTSSAFVTINSHAQIAGYYFGTLTSNVTGIVTDIEVIIGTNHETHAWDYVNFDSGYWGDLDITESVVSGTIFAQVWNPALVFPDGSQFGAISISGDVVPRQSMDGVYSGVGDTGTLGVQYVSEISNQPYSLADVSGIWTYSDGAGFSDSITISETGALDYSASDGCTAQGQLSVLDPLLNGFSFSYDMTCPAGVNPIPNGVRSGIAYVDDFFFVDTWIVMAGSIGNEGTLLSWSRPSAVSGGGLFQAAAKSESDTSLARGQRARR
jgi:PKD repeat protein